MEHSVFDKIYREDLWEGGSGIGSFPQATIPYRMFLETFIMEKEIGAVVDFGCGDWQFSRFIPWGGVAYTGYDVAQSVIERNRARYAAGNVRFEFTPADLTELADADLLICKDVLQHLPNSQVFEFLDAVKDKYRYLLITNCTKPYGALNTDIEPGGFRPLDIRFPPFNIDAELALTYKLPKHLGDFRKNTLLISGDKQAPDSPPPAVLPDDFQADQVAFHLPQSQKRSVMKGERFIIPVQLHNLSKITLKSHSQYPFNLSYHILDCNRNIVIHDGIRTRFLNPLAPGMRCEMNMAVVAPESAGSFFIAPALVREGCAWYELPQAPLLAIEVV